jgi:hypothetical protein
VGAAALVPAAPCAGVVLLELVGVVPLALDDFWPLLPPLALLPCELCEDVDDSVFAPASVVSPPLPESELSSPHAPAATSRSAAQPKRKVDLFMFIPVA